MLGSSRATQFMMRFRIPSACVMYTLPESFVLFDGFRSSVDSNSGWNWMLGFDRSDLSAVTLGLGGGAYKSVL